MHVLSDFTLPGRPEVFIVSNVREGGRPVGAINAGQYWHSDLSYTTRPTFASMLHAKQVPLGRGETMFASMVRACETLPEDIRERIAGCRAVHDYALAYETVFADNPDRTLTPEQAAGVPPVEHPVVRVQVETGRKALYVNPGFTRHIVGMRRRAARPWTRCSLGNPSARGPGSTTCTCTIPATVSPAPTGSIRPAEEFRQPPC